MHYIYCYTNKINQHKYVGQTNNIQRRQKEHLSNAFNVDSLEYDLLFHKKIREYGIDNFQFEILETANDNVLANQQEIYWIEQLKTYAGDNCGGYNLTRGGNCNVYKIYSTELIDQVKQDLLNGINYQTINIKYQISLGYISGINNGIYFKDDNLDYPLQKRQNNNEDISRVYKMLLDDIYSLREISHITDMSYSTIKKINAGQLHFNPEMEYPIRQHNLSQLRAKKIQNYLVEGKTDKEIQQLLNVSVQTISRINQGQMHYNKLLIYPLR